MWGIECLNLRFSIHLFFYIYLTWLQCNYDARVFCCCCCCCGCFFFLFCFFVFCFFFCFNSFPYYLNIGNQTTTFPTTTLKTTKIPPTLRSATTSSGLITAATSIPFCNALVPSLPSHFCCKFRKYAEMI